MTRNDIQIIIQSEKDSLGRQQFTAEWIADNVGPHLNDTGIRAQVFFCALDKWRQSEAHKGKHVIIVPVNQAKCGYVLKDGNWIKYDVHTWQPIN